MNKHEEMLANDAKLELKINEILVANKLNFTIDKLQLLSIDKKYPIPTPYYGLFNSLSGECINTCKDGYRVSQNDEIIRLVLEGIKPFGNSLKVYRAASINGGRKVFIQLEIAGLSRVGNDTIKKYITIIDSNDGSTGLSIGIGDLTMSCMNEYYKFYKKGEAKFRHTATLEQKIQLIPDLIETALGESIRQIMIYNKFASTKISKKLANECVNNLLGYDRVINPTDNPKAIGYMNSLYDHIEEQISDKGLNLWGLHSGVTSWTTHKLQEVTEPLRKNRIKKVKRENASLESMISGRAYNYNEANMLWTAQIAGITNDKMSLAPMSI